MSMAQQNIKNLEEVYDQLRPESRNQLESFATFLLRQQTSRKRQKPAFNWAGCLQNFDSSKSSVDVQHEIASLRTKDL